MKKIIIIALCSLMLCGCGEIPKLKNGEEAVVSFDENVLISNDDLYKEIKNKYAISSLIDMIDTTILTKEYPDSDEGKATYVDSNLKSVKANFSSDEEFLSALQQYYGMTTEDEFKTYLGLVYLRNLAIVDYAKTLVKEKEVKSYYEQNIKGDISARHILIKVDTTDSMTDAEKTAADEKALNTAKDLIKQLKKADNLEEKFIELAKEYSDDSSNASDGGDLGFFNTGKMVEQFEKAAYALKKGAYTTTPVKTTYGYHIILKTGEKEKASYNDSKDKIYETLANEKISADKMIQIDALTELRKDYGMKIEDSELSTQYSNYIQNLIASIESE